MTAAAKSLSLTPSAVSQQIAALEQESGVVLIERSGRGIRLTDAAHELAKRAEAILVELTRAEADLDAIKQATRGSLSIGAFPTAGTWLVPSSLFSTLRAFSGRHPEVNVRLTELEPEDSSTDGASRPD